MRTVSELMTRPPVSLPPRATVGQALATLHELDARHLPIVNADREVVGIVSDRDLRGRERQLDAALSDVMSGDVITLGTEAPVLEAVELMLEYKIGALPVVDPDGALVGIVSYIDVLRALEGLLAAEEE
jgi:acetoin utilization protein AcuB